MTVADQAIRRYGDASAQQLIAIAVALGGQAAAGTVAVERGGRVFGPLGRHRSRVGASVGRGLQHLVERFSVLWHV